MKDEILISKELTVIYIVKGKRFLEKEDAEKYRSKLKKEINMKKEVIKFSDGTVMSERQAEMAKNTQREFNRIKAVIKEVMGEKFEEYKPVDKSIKVTHKRKLMVKDIEFYNDFAGGYWDKNPIKLGE